MALEFRQPPAYIVGMGGEHLGDLLKRLWLTAKLNGSQPGQHIGWQSDLRTGLRNIPIATTTISATCWFCCDFRRHWWWCRSFWSSLCRRLCGFTKWTLRIRKIVLATPGNPGVDQDFHCQTVVNGGDAGELGDASFQNSQVFQLSPCLT